jgi:hypothetical protein
VLEAPADEPDAPVEPEEPPPPTYRPALDRDLSPDLDVAALARSAELTLERRIPGVGLDELLDLASAYRRDVRVAHPARADPHDDLPRTGFDRGDVLD